MATQAHDINKIPADGVKIASGAGDLTQGANAQAIASGAGNGRTFDRSVARYYLVTNSSGGALNLTVKATTPTSTTNAGTTVADNVISLDAYSCYLLETHKILAGNDGTVTLEASGVGLHVDAFY